VHLTKHQGLGNDFLVLADPSGSHPPSVALARAACDRHFGIGADGFLHLGPGGDGADVAMVLLNADGSRAEMSGNGIACLAQAAVLAGLAPPPVIRVATDAGPRTVELRGGEAPRTHVATVAMGAAAVGDDEPEWTDSDVLRATRVSIGNPHLVLHAARPELVEDREWIAGLGRRANEAIPGGINVEVVTPTDDGLAMDVYERGVGLTLACGTGACAAAAAAHRWELTGERVPVAMLGGTTEVDLSGPEVRMTSPVVFIGSIDYPWP
jgi:diaminopimelate epimerase